MAAGVAMAGAVEQVAGVAAGLKWPNDLVVGTGDGERKLAGILAEADWPAGSTASAGYRPPRPHERAVVVVGVGLNVSWPEVPDELDRLATALNLVGPEADRVELLVVPPPARRGVRGAARRRRRRPARPVAGARSPSAVGCGSTWGPTTSRARRRT